MKIISLTECAKAGMLFLDIRQLCEDENVSVFKDSLLSFLSTHFLNNFYSDALATPAKLSDCMIVNCELTHFIPLYETHNYIKYGNLVIFSYQLILICCLAI